MAWTWQLLDDNGCAVSIEDSSLSDQSFENQADAESWLGASWPELDEAGVAQVSLLNDGTLEYGPMSLES